MSCRPQRRTILGPSKHSFCFCFFAHYSRCFHRPALSLQDVKHLQNEVFFDIYEDIDCVIDPNGAVVRNDVRGVVNCKCNMSGTPDIALYLTDPKVCPYC